MKHGLRVFSAVVALAMLLSLVAPLTVLADEADAAVTSSAAESTTSTEATDEPQIDAAEDISSASTEAGDTSSDPAAEGETPAEGEAPAEGETSQPTTNAPTTSDKSEYDRENSYVNHLKRYDKEKYPQQEFIIPAASFISDEGADVQVLASYEGKENVVDWSSQLGKLTWQVEIPAGQGGLYNMALVYYPYIERLSAIGFEMRIDGKLQFNSMNNFEFNRVFVNETNDFRVDNRGNQLRPGQTQIGAWQENIFKDAEGIYNEGFYFYLSEGVHTISLECLGESARLESIRIYQKKSIAPYEEVKAGYDQAAIDSATTSALGDIIEIQAEKMGIKSDSALTPISDRTDPLTYPSHASQICMNATGAENWSTPGQWITWDFDVEEAGYYKIGMRYKQNYLRGMFVTRSIRIDDEVPFTELQNYRFDYTRNWGFETLSDIDSGEEFYFYFEPGKHTISMEVTLGDMSQILADIDECVYQLNYLYRKIIMITSTSPDTYRQYYLERKINDLIPRLTSVSNTLKACEASIVEVAGKGTEAATLEQAYLLIDGFIKQPYKLPRRLTEYKNNITTLASWVLTMKSQPIALDYIGIAPAQADFKRAEANFFESAMYEVNAFIASFTTDYTSIGGVAEDGTNKVITVWVGSGRDNANILKQMIDDMFTPETGIAVNLNLVQGSLIQAIAAGRNPDVTNSDRGTPMNLAIRGALVDLTRFEDYDEVMTRFHPQAALPYTLEGGVYALPETQSFNVMYYRTDVLEELGLEKPETWDDIYAMLPILQRSNLDVGMNGIYATLLYQRGGKYYTDDLSATTLTGKLATDVFTDYCELFTQYKLPVSYDFFNRFRTGEMPIGFAAFTFYNQLNQAAPEISGLWEMDMLPGTIREDGTIDRTEAGGGTSLIMIESGGSQKEDWAWEYMKWRTGTEAQARYGRELEALLGPTARIATANLEAFKQLDWSREALNVIEAQRAHLQEIEEVPGGYYFGRNFNNAFNDVINNDTAPRKALIEWTKQTDSEIARKRAEFGLK